MRKLLLASVAVLGAAGIAQAQVAVNPAVNVPNPVPSVPGVNAPAQGSPSGGMSTPAGLAPGQVQVRLNGRFNWYAGFIADGDANANYWTNSATAPTTAAWFNTVSSGTVTYTNQRPSYYNSLRLAPTTLPWGGGYSASGSNSVMVKAKNNQGFSLGSYIRLYPGFDGMAANGLRYGVAAEIRQDNGGNNNPGVLNAASGGGAAGSISAQNPKRSELYWRRAYGYVAGDSWGTLRFGSGDGPSTLYMTGNFENFNDSGWNGDLPSFMPNAPLWPFADVGSVYTTNKIVYLSPSFAGFEGAFSYAPTSNALSNASGCTLALASVGCDRLNSIDSSGNTKEQLRQQNFFEAFARYRGAFNGVGISAYGGWFGSNSINTNNALYTSALPTTMYKNNSIGAGGGQISYAGVTVGGMVQGGDFNRGQGFNPSPVGSNSSLAWLVGASYTTGPIIVGASYFQATTPGSYVASGQSMTPGGYSCGTGTASGYCGTMGNEQKERGFAAGATYAVAPGFSLFLSYLWGDRHQDGVNLLTGETWTGVSSTKLNSNGTPSVTYNPGGLFKNTVTVQAISLGTQLRW